MKKYSVLFKRNVELYHRIKVEAEDRHQARDLADAQAEEGFSMSDFTYMADIINA